MMFRRNIPFLTHKQQQPTEDGVKSRQVVNKTTSRR